jgi:polysaccharide export outer membrane protein
MKESLRKLALAILCTQLFAAGALAQFVSPAPTTPGIGNSTVSAPALIQRLRSEHPELRFVPDDIISVQVYKVKEFGIRARVDQAGFIQLPLVGNVRVQGLTNTEAKQQIAEVLRSSGMIKEPQVTLFLEESPSRYISVSGSVAKPGRFPAFGDQTLLGVLAAAGGLTADAGHIVTVLRPGFEGPVTLAVSADSKTASEIDVPLFAGDTVMVPKSGVVYLVGALRNQGVFPLKGSTPLTVAQAIAVGGGAGFEALLSQVHLVRTMPGMRTDTVVDVNKIRAGRVPDPALQPDDIVFVPTSQMKASVKGGAAAIAANLATGLGYIITH